MRLVLKAAVIVIVLVLVAAAIALMAMPPPDDRTASERLVLTASDLAGMNATQSSAPFPSPHHPVLHYGGSEAAESSFSMTVDGWLLDVECVLVLHSSSSSASQTFHEVELGTDYAEVMAGDGCFVGGYHNETFGGTQVVRMNVHAIMLENDTVSYFVFRAYPLDGSGTVSLQVIGDILKAQADKAQQRA